MGIDLVRLLASEDQRIFSTAAARALSSRVGMNPTYVAEALYHLRRNGWVVPLRRGLYALSSTQPGVAGPHEFEIAMALTAPAAVSHWSALHHYGLTDQPPRKVFVLTTTAASTPRAGRAAPHGRQVEDYIVQQIRYQFVRVKPERFFGTQRVWVGEAQVEMTDPERTLLDGLSAPQHFGDLGEVLHAFEQGYSELKVKRLVEYALRLDAATTKRLGWVLERQGARMSILKPLLDRPIKGYRRLDSSSPPAGPRNRKWMIQENLPGRGHS